MAVLCLESAIVIKFVLFNDAQGWQEEKRRKPVRNDGKWEQKGKKETHCKTKMERIGNVLSGIDAKTLQKRRLAIKRRNGKKEVS